jgi:hydroxyethylthiazole kinase-like uncharacterized protein yjeF
LSCAPTNVGLTLSKVKVVKLLYVCASCLKWPERKNIKHMHKPITSGEMKLLEEKGQRIGISKLVMMENAGSAISTFVHQLVSNSHSDSKKLKIVLVSGTGNNGGDTFVAARHLAYWENNDIVVLLVGNQNEIRTDEARTNWEIMLQIPKIKLVVIDDLAKIDMVDAHTRDAVVIIVGIFGTGFKGLPRELQLKVIERVNSFEGLIKISVDVPSGMEADSGVHDYSIKSNYTVTMHAPKVGMLTSGAREVTGEIIQANIGLPF